MEDKGILCKWCDEYEFEVTERFINIWADTGKEMKVFPLQTQQSMAERWGVTKNVISNWSKRHKDFPKEMEGVIEYTKGAPKVYPLYDVERYEQERGLKK